MSITWRSVREAGRNGCFMSLEQVKTALRSHYRPSQVVRDIRRVCPSNFLGLIKRAAYLCILEKRYKNALAYMAVLAKHLELEKHEVVALLMQSAIGYIRDMNKLPMLPEFAWLMRQAPSASRWAHLYWYAEALQTRTPHCYVWYFNLAKRCELKRGDFFAPSTGGHLDFAALLFTASEH